MPDPANRVGALLCKIYVPHFKPATVTSTLPSPLCFGHIGTPAVVQHGGVLQIVLHKSSLRTRMQHDQTARPRDSQTEYKDVSFTWLSGTASRKKVSGLSSLSQTYGFALSMGSNWLTAGRPRKFQQPFATASVSDQLDSKRLFLIVSGFHVCELPSV